MTGFSNPTIWGVWYKIARKLRNPAGGCGLSGCKFTIFTRRVHFPSEAVLPPSSCARTHAVHGRIQLYCTAVHDSCTVPRHQQKCDVIRHVIIGAARQNYKKNTRRKEEERPRTGTFFAPWGCMSVMQWPIFTGHFEALRFLVNWAPLKIQSLMYMCM